MRVLSKETKAKNRERNRLYRLTNKERIKASQHEYYLANKDKMYERVKRWRKVNPETRKAIRHRRRDAQREWFFLYNDVSKNNGGGFLNNTGICVNPNCFEIFPLLLENHHITKDFAVHLCADCHRLIHRFSPALEAELEYIPVRTAKVST